MVNQGAASNDFSRIVVKSQKYLTAIVYDITINMGKGLRQ